MPGFVSKDHFSVRSDKYARFRPSYPKELFDYLFSLVEQKQNAWDCGTGTGQVASQLANAFKKVYATDISDNQLKHAEQKENILYKKEASENTTFAGQFFDLITVAQAIHWFQFELFYKQVYRVLKPDGIFAVTGYGFPSIDEKTDRLFHHFYTQIVGMYWDEERKYIDEHYQTIPFPFNEIKAPDFKMELLWSFDQFVGYIQTWSAVQHYIIINQHDPVLLFSEELLKVWPQHEMKSIVFPVFLRVGALKTDASKQWL